MAEPGLTCQKCGCTELVTQLRKVLVDIGGWKMTQMYAIAPVRMCTKCGNLTVTMNAVIGDLAGLVPEPDAGGTPIKKVTPTKGKKAKGAKPAKGRKKAARKGRAKSSG